ncbi:hypothetical protein KY321_02335 [Candidatus Woesearchaeota archaeon]|nr:hypothetical protein [Candidatus Woesearchaeota archaeon]
MILNMLEDRKEDRLEPDLERRIDNLITKFQEGNGELATITEKQILVKQIELKLETDLENDLKIKFQKIREKLNEGVK